jgi:prepilin signal peptidase PulO-like enzyme (type II secretory pathway)
MSLFADPVFLVELVMLSAVLAIALYTSFTDLQQRRVPNRATLSLLGIGLAGQGAMVYLHVATWPQVAAVLLVALGIALGLTVYGFWAPGDAKLFWAASVALPPTLCPSRAAFSLQGAPEALLLNALLCYGLVLLLVPLWREETKGDWPERLPERRGWVQALWGLAGLLGWALAFAALVLERPLSYVETLAALIIGYRLLERGLPKAHWTLVLFPGFAVLIYWGYTTGGWRDYALLWGSAWLIELVYMRVRAFYDRALVQEVAVTSLEAGVIPHGSLFVQGEGESLRCVEAGKGEVLCQEGQPLSASQIGRLRLLGRRGLLPLGDRLAVETPLPFAPFIAAAAVLTAFFAGHVVGPLTRVVGGLAG